MGRWGAGGWFLLVGALGISGCGTGGAPEAAARPFRGVKVVVAALGDPAVLQTVAGQRGEWQETRGAELTITEAAIDPKAVRGADVLLFPGDRLGDLVDASALVALPEAVVRPRARLDEDESPGASSPEPGSDPLAFQDVVSAYRDQVTKYGEDRMALPYGGSALVLVFRREAMEGEANRSAAREAGLTLGPPETWEHFDALARFFQGRDWDGDGQADHGVALALAADGEGVGDATFLARAAGLGQHRDQYSLLFDADTMEPRIASPPFVEALAGLASLKEAGPPGAAGFDAEAARAAFRSGRVAMLIDRAERASRWTDPAKPMKVGVARLPGSGRVYDPARGRWEDAAPANRPSYLPRGGGWLVGIAAGSEGRRREAAIDLAKYLAGPEVSDRIRADRAFPMLPTRGDQLGKGLPDPRSAPGVDPRLWSQAVAETLTAGQVVPGLRIPGADGYLADLGKARVAAVGGQAAEEALREAARAWAGRTKSMGAARQLWHYRRSLNGPVTTSEPPAR